MTNDDKLRRLREKLVAEARISEDSRGYDSGKASPLWMLDEIDRLLAEPTSPAPAVAPSEGDALVDELADCLKTIRSFKKMDYSNGGGTTATEDRLAAALPKAIKRLRAATAPAASTPVTSEAIEAAIQSVSDAVYKHAAGSFMGIDEDDEGEHPAIGARRAKDDLRSLIASRVQQANAVAGDLARAVEACSLYLDGADGAMTQGSFTMLPNGLLAGLVTALAAFRRAQGGGS